MSPALLLLELRRLRRNRRTLIFTAVLPVVFFLAFASGHGKLAGIDVGAYVMVSMASYGAMNALFTGAGVIAAERSIGWNRQLRIGGLAGRDYVLTKVIVAYLSAVPGLVLVLLVGSAVEHVHLSWSTWILIAVSVLLALLPIAALGVAIGYAARPQSLQAVFGIGSALLSLLGGLWVPITIFPSFLREIVEVLPTYWSAAAGRSVLEGGWLGWHGTFVLAAWTAALVVAASVLYHRDALRPGAAGTT